MVCPPRHIGVVWSKPPFHSIYDTMKPNEEISDQLNRIENKLDQLLRSSGAKPAKDISYKFSEQKYALFIDCAEKVIEDWGRLESNWNRFVNETGELDITKKDFKLMVDNYLNKKEMM